MRISYTFFVALLVFIVAGCEEEGVVGSEDVIVHDGIRLTVDSTFVVNDTFMARGKAENIGNTRVPAVWKVEGVFYEDQRFRFKLGGNNTSIRFPLDPLQVTGWEISFSSDLYAPQDYPNFSISDLRAFSE
ncbi:MAG: hypothetical protein AAFW89_13685 [Bacteroidota bacterium]